MQATTTESGTGIQYFRVKDEPRARSLALTQVEGRDNLQHVSYTARIHNCPSVCLPPPRTVP